MRRVVESGDGFRVPQGKVKLPHTVVFQSDLTVEISELGRELDKELDKEW